jgi:hypothetical protein
MQTPKEFDLCKPSEKESAEKRYLAAPTVQMG